MRDEWSSWPTDYIRVLEALDAAPEKSLPNRPLMDAANVRESSLMQIRRDLLDAGLVRTRPGRGRPLVLLEHAIVDSGLRFMETREKELYLPIVEGTPRWSRMERYWRCEAFDVSSQGRRVTGGRWTRTDLLIAGVKHYQNVKYVPTTHVSLHAVEVKTWAGLDITAVFEVLAHGSDTTHQWVFCEVPPGDAESKLARVRQEAKRYGVGLVTFQMGQAREGQTWTTEVEAIRRDTSPRAVEQYVSSRTSEKLKSFLADAVSEARYSDASSLLSAGTADIRALESE